MRNLLLYIVLMLPALTMAQEYGDEWVNYSQKYWRIPVGQDGIYRLDFDQLSQAGFPVSTVDPRRIQLFRRGSEVAIHVEGQEDARFDPEDYILYYGQRNDGKTDTPLYPEPSAQPHDLYSIFTDTSSYYLTYSLTPLVTGKRMGYYKENNTSGLAPEPTSRSVVTLINSQEYAPGVRSGEQDLVVLTAFDQGEGWSGNQFQEGDNAIYSLNGINDVQGNPRLHVLLQGRDNTEHVARISAGPDALSQRQLGTETFDDYESLLFSYDLSTTDISPFGELTVDVSCLGSGGNDLISVSYLQLEYYNQPDMAGRTMDIFRFTATTGSSAYLEIDNVPPGTEMFDISDAGNVIRVGHNRVGQQVNAMLRNAASERTVILSTPEPSPVPGPARFRNIDYSRADYVVITHESLRLPAAGYDDPVQAYASYRASPDGGGYDTLVLNIQTLYNQFSYGDPSPLAVYNFMRKFVDRGSPRYLFLVGKGIGPEYDFHRNPAGYVEIENFGVTYQLRDLVPVAGTPGADITYTAGLNGTRFEAAVATGRITAVSSAQVVAYLEKVMEMEAQPYNDLYRKSLLHLSGGIQPAELISFRQYMDGFASRAEDPFLGGRVTTIQKENSSPVELINISEEVNAGVGMVTFFGHSSSAVTDIDIGFVTDPAMGYSNLNKYPVFLVNGCLAGQFFQPDIVFGEDWINASDRGATGFIAHSSFGYSSALRRYTDYFYETAFNDSVFVTKPVGNIQQEVGRRYQASSAPSDLTITQVQQMVLLGDPAIRIFNAPLPDYSTSEDVVDIRSTDNRPLTSRSAEIMVDIVASNFGRTFSDSLSVRIVRTLESNEQYAYDTMVPPVLFRDTIHMVLPNDMAGNSGSNQFMITLDPDNRIDELNETNNSALVDLFLPSNATVNLYPVDYALLSSPEVELLAQSTDLFGTDRLYTFEIDTAASFDSPVLQTMEVMAGQLARFDPGSLPMYSGDSITYFWRTRFTQPGESESDEWEASSFSIIPGSDKGWTQRAYHQFTENNLDDLVFLEDQRRIEFSSQTTAYAVYTAGEENPLTNQEVSVLIDNVQYNIENQYCRDNTINFISFNRNSSLPYPGLSLPVSDSRICGRQPQVINSFTTAQANAAAMGIAAYVSAIPEGDIVSFFTIGRVNYSSFSGGVRSSLESIGISLADLDTWTNGEAVFVIGRKGAVPGTAHISRSQDLPPEAQEVAGDSIITGFREKGNIESVLIGPAGSWGNLEFSAGLEPGDNLALSVTGIGLDGNSSMLYSDITSGIDLSGIDAVAYPFLRLSATVEDPVNRTAPRIHYWQVDHESVPEGILAAREVSQPPVDAPEGAVITNVFSFVNISDKEFPDSLEVRFRLYNPDQQKSREQIFRIAPPASGDSTEFSVVTSTRGFGGLNDYSLYVNPELLPEQYYENNRYDRSGYLSVKEDLINPLIDVVFDGAYIMDGDIVSPTPRISVKILDDNKLFPKTDTTGITLQIKQGCDGCQFTSIPFSSPYVQWFPATEDMPFRIEYTPPTLGDGMYTLRIQASDASGNQAGEEPYMINFEVINESTITNFYPYPNPFSTSTRFVFTLTGTYVPDGIKIQILTVTGRVVREITTEELGPVRIGHNISEYAWDGRDQFGDQLANGVYLYRVILDTGSGSIEHRSTAGDKAFDKGFGKLYILR